MAAAAVRTEFTIVYVIGPMATTAAVTGSLHYRQRTAVAVVAGNIQVSAVYFEIGLFIVIKQPQVPGDRVMAGLAVVLKLARVRIVVQVATDALGIGFSKNSCIVACVALEIVMLPQKRESRQIMIE